MILYKTTPHTTGAGITSFCFHIPLWCLPAGETPPVFFTMRGGVISLHTKFDLRICLAPGQCFASSCWNLLSEICGCALVTFNTYAPSPSVDLPCPSSLLVLGACLTYEFHLALGSTMAAPQLACSSQFSQLGISRNFLIPNPGIWRMHYDLLSCLVFSLICSFSANK